MRATMVFRAHGVVRYDETVEVELDDLLDVVLEQVVVDFDGSGVVDLSKLTCMWRPYRLRHHDDTGAVYVGDWEDLGPPGEHRVVLVRLPDGQRRFVDWRP